MTECEITEALTNAEKACRDAIARYCSLPVYRFANPGEPDCAVFDIGYSQTGDMHLCQAQSYHFRASLDLYRRGHDELQREIMRLVSALPISADLSNDADLRADSNVIMFRIAPETRAIGPITATTIEPPQGGAAVAAYTATIAFDVVFAARFA